MVGANEMPSWATDASLWFLGCAAILLTLASLWRVPHPNHVFFLRLIERLEESAHGASPEKPLELSPVGTCETPTPDAADRGSDSDPNGEPQLAGKRHRDRWNKSASTDLEVCGAGRQDARKR